MKIRDLLSLIFAVLILPVIVLGKSDWTSLRTPNFLIAGDVQEQDLKRFGIKFENFRQAFAQIFPNSVDSKAIAPTTIIVFKTEAEVQNFGLLNANSNWDKRSGWFLSSDETNYIVISLDNESNQTYQSIFHDYARYLVEKSFGSPEIAPWLKEGAASYFQTFRLKNDQTIVFGEASTAQLPNELPFSFEKLFNTDYSALQNLNNTDKDLFKTESLAVFYYLQSDDARRVQTTKFLKLLAENKKPSEAFANAFQIDYAAAEKSFKSFFKQHSFASISISLRDLPTNNLFQAAKNAESDPNAILGNLLLSRNRVDEAVKLLQMASMLDPNSAAVHASLGVTLVRQNKFAEADAHFEKAIALDSNNFRWYYTYASALSREEMDKTGFVRYYNSKKAAQMRELLDQTIELNPNFPEAYRLSASINYVNNEDLSGGLELLDQALALDPGNSTFWLDRAQIYVRQEKFDDAEKIGQKIFGAADNTDLRNRARVLLTSISLIRAELKRVQEIGVPAAKKVAPAIEMSQEEALNEALNEALRKPKSGEKRFVGYLTSIDCSDNGVDFIVRPQNQPSPQPLKLNTTEFKKVFLRTFAPGLEGNQIDCGARGRESFVVVTYRPALKNSNTNEIIALEFVPNEFKLLP